MQPNGPERQSQEMTDGGQRAKSALHNACLNAALAWTLRCVGEVATSSVQLVSDSHSKEVVREALAVIAGKETSP
jgi:hypothetical protein